MSDLEEDEDDMPEDKDSTCSGIASEDKDDEDRDGEDEVVVADLVVADVDRDGDGETRGEDEEEDSSDDFFDAGEGAVIGPDRLSLRAASESGQNGSGGGTEDDPVGPMTPSAAATIPHNNNKPTAVDFSSRTISSASTDLDDEEYETRRLYHLRLSNSPHPLHSYPRSLSKLIRPAARRVGSGRSHVWPMYCSRRAWRKVCRRTGHGASRRWALHVEGMVGGRRAVALRVSLLLILI